MPKSNLLLLDTSFLFALLVENDVNHEKASFIMSEVLQMGKTLLLSHRVKEETATVLLYKEKKKGIDMFLRFLETQAQLVLFEDVPAKEWEFFIELNKCISFIDASLLYHAKDKNIPILTFDKQLQNLV